MELRDYQKSAVNAFFEGVRNGKLSGIICAPTGSGKTLIIAEIIRFMQENYPETKILLATHSQELVEQNSVMLLEYYPSADVGIYSSALKRKETTHKITFCGIQSVYKHAFDFGKVDLLIIDESHLVNPSEQTEYGKFISNLRLSNPNLVLLGLSATPYRLKSGLQWEGDDRLFDACYYEIEVLKLVELGYLCPIISKGGVKTINLSNVSVVAGEFNQKQLQDAANRPDLTKSAVDEIINYSADRESVIIFTSGIKHAKAVCEEINSRGHECHIVTGKTPINERNKILQEYKDGKFKFLTNVNVLTTGFDNPRIDTIALLFATKSCAKYVQVVGRGMRLYPSKKNCLLLDFGGNVLRHGCIDEIRPPVKKSKKGSGDMPARECPICHTISQIQIKICPECGYEFPVKIPFETKAYEGVVLSNGTEWTDVDQIDYSRHKKDSKPDSVRVDFYTTKRQKPISMWLPLESKGYPREMALKYVRLCGGKANNTDEALKECNLVWKEPKRIEIKKNKQTGYYEVLAFDMPDENEEQKRNKGVKFNF